MTDTLSYNNNIHDYDEQETAMKVFLAVYKNLCDRSISSSSTQEFRNS